MLGTIKAIHHLMYRNRLNCGAFQRVGEREFLAGLIAQRGTVPEAAITEGRALFRDM
jgi:hypothetical protein